MELASRRPRKGYSILVVDDDAAALAFLVSTLHEGGYQIVSARGSSEALDKVRTAPEAFDLIITDIEMPRLNGSDLCAHLIEERPGIKVIVMSGKDIAEIVDQNIHLHFLPKPFDGETIKKRVREILGFSAQAVEGTVDRNCS